MFQVTHICPRCGHQELAPIFAVNQGDAGIWVCGGCDMAFQIEIRFSPFRVDSSGKAIARKPNFAKGERSLPSSAADPGLPSPESKSS